MGGARNGQGGSGGQEAGDSLEGPVAGVVNGIGRYRTVNRVRVETCSLELEIEKKL